MRAFFRLATLGSVMRRAAWMAVIVGSIQVGINHGDALLRGEISQDRLIRICLTCLVPYCVSTCSSVLALRASATPVPETET